jgi:predicted metal-dependent phosphoesterase TrpH
MWALILVHALAGKGQVTRSAESRNPAPRPSMAQAGDPHRKPGIPNVDNPYADVNWTHVLHLKAALHTHTAESLREHPLDSATGTVADRVAKYESLGFAILAITDHDHITHPWDKYGVEETRLIPIPGNELSKSAHVLSYFSLYEDNPGRGASVSNGFDENIRQVGLSGGLAFIAHPARGGSVARSDFLVDAIRRHDCIVGMEVLNVGQYQRNHSEGLWDEVLSQTMPRRNLWGTASEDAHHDGSARGAAYTCMLLPPEMKTPHGVREAMRRGWMYFSTWTFADDKILIAGPAPQIDRISLSDGIIAIEATGADEIQWISAGKVVATGSSLSLLGRHEVRRYVRARLIARGGQTMTQPFGIRWED